MSKTSIKCCFSDLVKSHTHVYLNNHLQYKAACFLHSCIYWSLGKLCTALGSQIRWGKFGKLCFTGRVLIESKCQSQSRNATGGPSAACAAQLTRFQILVCALVASWSQSGAIESCSATVFSSIVFYRRKTQASGFEWDQDPRATCKNIFHSVWCLSWHLPSVVIWLEAKCKLREGCMLFGDQPKRTVWNVKYIYFIHSNALFKHTFRQTFVHLHFTSTNIHRKYVFFWLLAHTDWNTIRNILTLDSFQGFPPFYFYTAENTYFSVNIVYRTQKRFKLLPEHVCWRNKGWGKERQIEKQRKTSLIEGNMLFPFLLTQRVV